MTSAIPVQRSNQLSYQANWELRVVLAHTYILVYTFRAEKVSDSRYIEIWVLPVLGIQPRTVTKRIGK